ncbi:MAG: hypothetical protein WA783_03310 [Phormidesmis sp.]
MNGSRPKPPARPKSSRPQPASSQPSRPVSPPPRRKRRTQPAAPWVPIISLFVIYSLVGLLITLPTPPYWVWIGVIVAIPLLVLGLNRPVAMPGKPDRGGLMAYSGGLLLAIALAVSANYIGSDSSFEDARFFAALIGLAALSLLAVLLTVAAATASATAGARFLSTLPYSRSIVSVIMISFLGLVAGAIAGLLFTTLGKVAA